tara:strand:- start:692 stop:892 length:201 start_codon:yes stop_codon:yes gene_type:complete
MTDVRPIEEVIFILLELHHETKFEETRSEVYNKLLGLCMAVASLNGGCYYRDVYDHYMEVFQGNKG